MQQLDRVARQLALWSELRTLITTHSLPATRVLVLWGGDRNEALEPREHSACVVLHGRDLKTWTQRQPPALADEQWRRDAWTSLDRLIQKRETHDPKLTQVPRSVTDHLSRLGVTTAVAVTSFLAFGWLLRATTSPIAPGATALVAAGSAILGRRKPLRPLTNGVLAASVAIGLIAVAAAATALS